MFSGSSSPWLCPERHRLHWRFGHPESAPVKPLMPSCWPTGKKTAAGYTERVAATQYGSGIKREQVNGAGKNRKESLSLTKISHVLLSPLSPELLGGARQTTSGMPLYLLPVFRSSSQAPSTHKTLSWPWGAGWVARWAHAKNSFLCRENPASPPYSRDIHQSSWVLLTSNAKPVSLAFRKTGHLSIALGKEPYGSSASYIENLKGHRH